MSIQVFRQSTAGTLRFRPREGPPTSPTLGIWTPGNSALVAAGTAATVAVSTTINAGASEGARTLSVASGTGIVAGGWYILGDVGSDRLEWVRVRKLAGTALTLVDTLEYDHDSGESFKSAEITYSLTTTHTAALDRNYRVEWTWTVGSDTHYATDTFDVVKRPFRLTLTPADLYARIPPSLLKSTAAVWELNDLIDAAEVDIRNALEDAGKVPDRVRTPSEFTRLGILGVARILLDHKLMIDASAEAQFEAINSQWAQEWGRIMSSGISWYDDDESLSVGEEDEIQERSHEERVQTVNRMVLG